MTFLRRTPREVYRVYGEEEFLADPGREQQFTAVTSGGRERRLRRVAGAAMLAGAVSALGGLVAVNILRPVRGSGRQLGARPHPATVVPMSSRGPRARTRRHRVDQARTGRRRADAGRLERGRHGERRGERRAGPVQGRSQDMRVQTAPTIVEGMTASAPAAPEGAGRAEFGFER